MTNDTREAAAMNLHMHDEGDAYGEHLAEQIVAQFKDAAKTDALVREVTALTADRFESMENLFRFEGIDEKSITSWRAAAELSYGARVAHTSPPREGAQENVEGGATRPPTEAAYLVGSLGIQLPWRLTEKVSQESVTSEPNNNSQDNHGSADYHGDGNKGRKE
jgi:hypothetical protein